MNCWIARIDDERKSEIGLCKKKHKKTLNNPYETCVRQARTPKIIYNVQLCTMFGLITIHAQSSIFIWINNKRIVSYAYSIIHHTPDYIQHTYAYPIHNLTDWKQNKTAKRNKKITKILQFHFTWTYYYWNNETANTHFHLAVGWLQNWER